MIDGQKETRMYYYSIRQVLCSGGGGGKEKEEQLFSKITRCFA